MHKPMQKRRPERLKPSLKQQTPIELRRVAAHNHANALRWEYLFSINLWKPAK